MNDLGQRIARLIDAQGPLSVAQFMTMALHDPQGGYYATRDPFGAGGDFITAPEISQMFGELLGLWIAQCWLDQGAPRGRLVELGPGRGTLMADVLRATRTVPGFLSSIDVVMVEASPTLTAIQKESLKNAPAPVRWVTRFEDAAGDAALFLLANEFFDALPIRQFVKTKRGWRERMVIAHNGKLDFAVSPEPVAFPVPRINPPDGAFYETSPASVALAVQIGNVIAHHGGAALIVDYGYGADAGFGETLQAVRAHQFAPVLDAPGEADLTAHVDFAALAYAARSGKAASTFGPAGQGDLLNRLGIRQRGQALIAQNSAARDTITSAIARLTDPQNMGTLFKALAILPQSAPRPPGF